METIKILLPNTASKQYLVISSDNELTKVQQTNLDSHLTFLNSFIDDVKELMADPKAVENYPNFTGKPVTRESLIKDRSKLVQREINAIAKLGSVTVNIQK